MGKKEWTYGETWEREREWWEKEWMNSFFYFSISAFVNVSSRLVSFVCWCFNTKNPTKYIYISATATATAAVFLIVFRFLSSDIYLLFWVIFVYSVVVVDGWLACLLLSLWNRRDWSCINCHSSHDTDTTTTGTTTTTTTPLITSPHRQ